jgi:alpha-amylase/alpha-mannosidase (GH57 family)
MNNKKLYLGFVWHMHQPYYKDDKAGSTFMPWVFLHAIKDYYDIPWYSENYPKIKATYNLVPSLIAQIESYINKSANDTLLQALQYKVEDLDRKHFEHMQGYLFLSNEKNMIHPLARYHDLFLKYKVSNSVENFDTQEILDAQVLFLLSWCGNYLRQNNTIVKHLLEKQGFYSHEDKLSLIQTLLAFLPQVLMYYKHLQENKKISLSTTPYYHPIMPLLLDTKSAIEAREDVVLPKLNHNFHTIGQQNVLEAIEYHEKIFHTKPTGFWPAEGSVGIDTIKLFCEHNINWFCTDEEILFKTIHDRNKQNIYKNYSITVEGKTIQARFRDHYLSDAIGFEYSQKEPHIAAAEFVKHLQNIYNSCDFSPLVNVILDGENAWEFFPNNAQEFFHALYELLENSSWIQTVTMDEIEKIDQITTIPLSSIASGSWINGNFDIWIGSEEKNEAWELLDLTYEEYLSRKQTLDSSIIPLIEKEVMIALGSDWFWWYGDDHFTVQAKEFDELFRKHLINIFEYMEVQTPARVLTPIIKNTQNNAFHTKPSNYITPYIDGEKSNYFEWLGSGVIDLSKEFSVMDGSKNVIQKILYGYDQDNIYFFFEANFQKNHTLHLYCNDREIIIQPKQKELELKISKDSLTIENNTVEFELKLYYKEDLVQNFPIYNKFAISLEECELFNWYV